MCKLVPYKILSSFELLGNQRSGNSLSSDLFPSPWKTHRGPLISNADSELEPGDPNTQKPHCDSDLFTFTTILNSCLFSALPNFLMKGNTGIK